MVDPHEQSRAASALPLAAALIPKDAELDVVNNVTRGVARLETCNRVADAERLIYERGALALFTSRHDADGVAVDEFVTRLRQEWPHFPVVLVESATGARRDKSKRQLVVTDVVRTDDPTFRRRACALLARAHQRARRIEIAHQFAASFDNSVRRAVEVAFEGSDRPRMVRELAAAVGVPRKTLDRRLLRVSPFSARQLIGWGRLIAAALALENTAATVIEVADELHFASPSALRNLLQRYARLTPTQLRRAGGADHLAARLMRAMERVATGERPLRGARGQ